MDQIKGRTNGVLTWIVNFLLDKNIKNFNITIPRNWENATLTFDLPLLNTQVAHIITIHLKAEFEVSKSDWKPQKYQKFCFFFIFVNRKNFIHCPCMFNCINRQKWWFNLNQTILRSYYFLAPYLLFTLTH